MMVQAWGVRSFWGPGVLSGEGGEVSLLPSILHALPTEMCIIPTEQSQNRALQSGSLSSGVSAFGTPF